MKDMAAVILAAGKGVRMHSELPKVLHKVAGQTMIGAVCEAASTVAEAGICIVVGYGAAQVRAAMGEAYCYALQEEQLGTGHAVQQAVPAFKPLPSAIMVLCGDTPLLRSETLQALGEYFFQSGAACTVLTAVLPEGGNYGRIVRDTSGNVEAIVEAKDATPAQLAIREINSGVYCFDGAWLQKYIFTLKNDNAQGEYYLTDVLCAMREAGGVVNALVCEEAAEILGVNDRLQLAEANRIRWQRKNEALMLSGVTILDPATAYIDHTVTVGQDTIIEPQVYLSGATVIGKNCNIGPGVKMLDAQVGDSCKVGPFTFLRPGTVLEDNVKAGHFVEIKNSHIGQGSKVPHLSYMGDAEVGERVNIGCGTITCNYDGAKKHKTIIGDDVFVGSNTNFIAPVSIGERATVGAGSTITCDVPAENLGVARGKQRNIAGWAKARDPRFRKKDDK